MGIADRTGDRISGDGRPCCPVSVRINFGSWTELASAGSVGTCAAARNHRRDPTPNDRRVRDHRGGVAPPTLERSGVDARVAGRAELLGVVGQFLVQFLARAGVGDFDRDRPDPWRPRARTSEARTQRLTNCLPARIRTGSPMSSTNPPPRSPASGSTAATGSGRRPVDGHEVRVIRSSVEIARLGQLAPRSAARCTPTPARSRTHHAQPRPAPAPTRRGAIDVHRRCFVAPITERGFTALSER